MLSHGLRRTEVDECAGHGRGKRRDEQRSKMDGSRDPWFSMLHSLLFGGITPWLASKLN